ncbi:uncharacterized protein BO95DRAFT_507067, partial [Aspergillus brunneoviolaceus CBS 621.78]
SLNLHNLNTPPHSLIIPRNKRQRPPQSHQKPLHETIIIHRAPNTLHQRDPLPLLLIARPQRPSIIHPVPERHLGRPLPRRAHRHQPDDIDPVAHDHRPALPEHALAARQLRLPAGIREEGSALRRGGGVGLALLAGMRGDHDQEDAVGGRGDGQLGVVQDQVAWVVGFARGGGDGVGLGLGVREEAAQAVEPFGVAVGGPHFCG